MKCGNPRGQFPRRADRGRTGRGRGPPRESQGGIARQDLLVQFPQPGPGFGAEFLDEHLAGALIGGERLGLPSVTVEGEHELGVQAFPERITGDQAPQLGDHVRVPPQVQVGVDSCFQCLQPHLGQTGDLPVRQ